MALAIDKGAINFASCSKAEWRRFVKSNISIPSTIRRSIISNSPVKKWALAVRPGDCDRLMGLLEKRFPEIELRDIRREELPISDDELSEALSNLYKEHWSEWNLIEEHDVITDDDAWLADSAWALQAMGEGRFSNPEKDYVAIYLKKVQAFGDNPVELQDTLGRKFCVPPQRIVTFYVGNED